ncbi:MAG TPA: hypothetical protein VF111_09560, partial [Thermoanaerobaculia bacterium]
NVDRLRVPLLHRLRRDDGESRFWGFVLDRVLRRPLVSALIAGGVLVALLLGLGLPRLKRELRLRRAVNEAIGDGSGIRQRVDHLVDGPRLMTERSDRGDAYRALRSLLEAVEQGRDVGGDVDREIRRRVRDLLSSFGLRQHRHPTPDR